MLLFVDDLLERIVVFFRNRLHTQHHVAVHLHEAAVGIPCETRIARPFGHGLDRLVVHAEVQNRVHHTGHRSASTRTHRNEQRQLLVAELHAGQPLNILHRALDLGPQQLDDGFLAVRIELGANLRRNGKTRGHGDADEVHLREVGALTAQQLTHFTVSFGLFVAECVDSFNVCHNTCFYSGFSYRFLFALTDTEQGARLMRMPRTTRFSGEGNTKIRKFPEKAKKNEILNNRPGTPGFNRVCGRCERSIVSIAG